MRRGITFFQAFFFVLVLLKYGFKYPFEWYILFIPLFFDQLYKFLLHVAENFKLRDRYNVWIMKKYMQFMKAIAMRRMIKNVKNGKY